MKKVNFKKLTNQFLAGVFGLALMGGVMLNTQDVEAQQGPINLELVDLNPGGSGAKSKSCQSSDASGGGGAFFCRECGGCKTKYMTRGSKGICTK